MYERSRLLEVCNMLRAPRQLAPPARNQSQRFSAQHSSALASAVDARPPYLIGSSLAPTTSGGADELRPTQLNSTPTPPPSSNSRSRQARRCYPTSSPRAASPSPPSSAHPASHPASSASSCYAVPSRSATARTYLGTLARSPRCSTSGGAASTMASESRAAWPCWSSHSRGSGFERACGRQRRGGRDEQE